MGSMYDPLIYKQPPGKRESRPQRSSRTYITPKTYTVLRAQFISNYLFWGWILMNSFFTPYFQTKRGGIKVLGWSIHIENKSKSLYSTYIAIETRIHNSYALPLSPSEGPPSWSLSQNNTRYGSNWIDNSYALPLSPSAGPPSWCLSQNNFSFLFQTESRCNMLGASWTLPQK